MRIALFSGNYNYIREGANQALNRLAAFLESERGCTVRVYSPSTETPAFEPAGTLVPVPSIAMPVRSEFRLALGLSRPIRRDLADFAPDLVHVATPDILDHRAQTWALRRGVPVVASLHTRFETYLGYYGLDWLRPLADAIQRRFYRRSDHVLAPTPELVEAMRRLRGDDAASLWSRGVDRDLFRPERRNHDWRAAHDIGADELVILFFGRLVLEKGVRTFVDTVRALQARDARIRPLIVGDGPAAEEFAALPGALFTGHLQGFELATAVASADILLHPSTTEAFGNVLLEAMASGLAVAAAQAPSTLLLAEDGRNALLWPAGRLDLAIAAVERLANSPELRSRLGAAARAASAAWSWDAACASAADAYERVATVHRRSDTRLQPAGWIAGEGRV